MFVVHNVGNVGTGGAHRGDAFNDVSLATTTHLKLSRSHADVDRAFRLRVAFAILEKLYADGKLPQSAQASPDKPKFMDHQGVLIFYRSQDPSHISSKREMDAKGLDYSDALVGHLRRDSIARYGLECGNLYIGLKGFLSLADKGNFAYDARVSDSVFGDHSIASTP